MRDTSTQNSFSFVQEMRNIVDKVIEQDSLSPDNKIVAGNLKHFADLLYKPGELGYNLSLNDKKNILVILGEAPLPAEYKSFYDKICSGSYKSEKPSMLDMVRVISIMSEIEHDKGVYARAMATTNDDLQKALLADSAAKGIIYIPLADLKNAPDSQTKLATQKAAFRLLHNYPYNWAEDRTSAELIAYEHILPEGLKDGDSLVYISTAAPPLSAIAAIQLAKEQGKNIRVAYIDEDAESAMRGKLEIARLEELGIIEEGQIVSVHSDFASVIDYRDLLGQMPASAIITAMVPNKVAVAAALKASGVKTATALNVEGLAQLMYYPVDTAKIAEAFEPVRGIALPAHLDEPITRKDVGMVKSNPEKEFWTTPYIFSSHKWQSREDDRVINPTAEIHGSFSATLLASRGDTPIARL